MRVTNSLLVSGLSITSWLTDDISMLVLDAQSCSSSWSDAVVPGRASCLRSPTPGRPAPPAPSQPAAERSSSRGPDGVLLLEALWRRNHQLWTSGQSRTCTFPFVCTAGQACIAADVTYLLCLLRTMLILLARGRFFSGMENQVFLPMITTFCFPGTQTRVLKSFTLIS